MIGSVPISNLHGHKRALSLGQATEAMYSVPKSGQSRQNMNLLSCVQRPMCRKWKRLYSLVWLSFIDLTTSPQAMLEDFGKKQKFHEREQASRVPRDNESIACVVRDDLVQKPCHSRRFPALYWLRTRRAGARGGHLGPGPPEPARPVWNRRSAQSDDRRQTSRPQGKSCWW